MSTTALRCSHCQARLKLKRAPQAGQAFRCPGCGGEVVVGESQTEAPARNGQRLLLIALAGLLLLGGALIGVLASGLLDGTPQVAEQKPPDTNPATVAPKKAPDPTDDPADAKKREEFLALMIDGGTAFQTNQWKEARSAYEKALALYPDNASAQAKLGQVTTALQALEAQAKVALEDKPKLPKEVVVPKDVPKTETPKGPDNGDPVADKKLDEFKAHLAKGKAALSEGRYADAIGESVAAELLFPKDAQAVQLRQQAEQKLAFQNAKVDRAEFQGFLDKGTAALKNQQFDEAARFFQDALKIFPKDKTAAKGVDDAKAGLKNLKDEFNVLMARGTKAANENRMADAVDAFREAKRLAPTSEAASKALRQAETILDNQKSYVTAMKRGAFALRQERYLEAVAAYRDALMLVPNDPVAQRGLVDAQRGLDAELMRQKDFDFKIQTATAAAKQKRYAEASQAFADALKIYPNHPQAAGIARQGRYNQAMADGTNAMNAKRYPDAVRAFQMALSEVPGDFTAQAALTRARVLNGK